jgi:amidase
MKSDEYTSLDATALADLVRRKQVKPIELVEAAIDLIEQLNPTLNAVVTPMYEQARAGADGKLPEGPFTGGPFLLKDLGASYGGVRMTMGSAFLSNFHPGKPSARLIPGGGICPLHTPMQRYRTTSNVRASLLECQRSTRT